MDSQDLEKIKDRIAKLLRMAADASSPNEAAIAAGRARKLMDQYQLDSFDVGNRITEEFASEPGSRFFAAIPQYMSIFAVAVAKYNDCQARFESGHVTYKKKDTDPKQWGKRIVFMGYKSDVQLAIQMFEQLNEVVNRLCKEWMNSQGLTSYSVRIGGQFKLGAFGAIGSRLNEMTTKRDEITSDVGSTGALVVIKKAAVDEKFGAAKYGNSKTRAVDMSDHMEVEARRTGRAKGSVIEIVKSVEA